MFKFLSDRKGKLGSNRSPEAISYSLFPLFMPLWKMMRVDELIRIVFVRVK